MTRIIAICAVATGISCASGTDHAPAARILVTPAYIPQGDAYTTDVTLDGSKSDDAVDDPFFLQPLLYDWTLDDPNPQFAPDARSPRVTVRVAGTRPVTIRLTISDGRNTKTTTTAQIGLTLP